jgi:hypothetical protein
MKQCLQNVRTTVLSDDEDERQKSEKNLFFFDVALRFAPRRTLVVVALVHHREQLGVLVNHSRCGNRRRRRRRHRSSPNSLVAEPRIRLVTVRQASSESDEPAKTKTASASHVDHLFELFQSNGRRVLRVSLSKLRGKVHNDTSFFRRFITSFLGCSPNRRCTFAWS